MIKANARDHPDPANRMGAAGELAVDAFISAVTRTLSRGGARMAMVRGMACACFTPA